MVRHIVTWILKEENKQENIKTMKKMLEDLKPELKVIKELEVGINENGGEYDIVLSTLFDNYDDLKSYDESDEHEKVKEFVRGVVKQRVAVDYTI